MNVDYFKDTFKKLENELVKKFQSDELDLEIIKNNFRKSLYLYYYESQNKRGIITSCSKFLTQIYIEKRAQEFLGINDTKKLKKELTEDENFNKLMELSDTVFDESKETFRKHERITSKTHKELGHTMAECKILSEKVKSFNQIEAWETYGNIYYDLLYINNPISSERISERIAQYYKELPHEEKLIIKENWNEARGRQMEYIKTGGKSGGEER